MGLQKYINGFTPTTHADSLEEPLRWKQPHNIFICSIPDLFHESVPFSFIDKVISIINVAEQHDF
jgi:protein gp37